MLTNGYESRETSLAAVLGFGMRGRWGTARFELSYTRYLRSTHETR